MVGPTPEPRPFFVEVGVGLGFVGIGLIGLQFVITGRFRSIAPIFGGDVVLQFHKQIGIVAVGLVLAHPAVLIASEPDYLEFFDPRVNILRALALTAVVPALVLLLVTSLWREFGSRLNYEWWRVGHGCWHSLSCSSGWCTASRSASTSTRCGSRSSGRARCCGLMYLVVHTPVVRPMLMKRRPYRVAEVRRELPDTYTLVWNPSGTSG
jgi:hypothetical protein